MNIMRHISDWWLFRKYKKESDLMFSTETEKFETRMRLTNHPIPEVRNNMISNLGLSHYDDMNHEILVVNRLVDCMLIDQSEVVRSTAACALANLLANSSKTTLGIDTYPNALRAITEYLNTAPAKSAGYLCEDLEMNKPDRFFWTFKNTEGSNEFITTIGTIARNKTGFSGQVRNSATIILRRLNDKRCREALEALATDTNNYVSDNAKMGLEELNNA